MSIATKIAAAIICLYSLPAKSQINPPVKWATAITQQSSSEMLLLITADMAPGWHLYSQYIKEGGPQPTTILLNKDSGFESIGKAIEKGKKETYYDDIYEMEITSFSEKVQFQQKVKINQYADLLTGYVNYMMCNHEVCVPNQHKFVIEAKQLKRKP